MIGQSSDSTYDVFISYAREDLPFARRLKDALEAAGRNVWVDVEGTFGGEEFWPQICDGIEKADTFVFVISPDSADSQFCRQEIEYAHHHNKRIVPLVRAAVDGRNLPEAVAARQWIFFRDDDPFDRALAAFIEAIDTDHCWLKGHTRLLTQAIAWENRDRDKSFMLRGHGLQEAEQLLTESAGKEPAITPLQTQFVLASQRFATNRQRIVLGWVTFALMISIGLGSIAFYQYQLSETRGKAALGRLLATQSINRRDSQLDLSILLTLEAHRIHPDGGTEVSILAGLQHNPRLLSFMRGHEGTVNTLAFSLDGKWLASGGADHDIILWDLRTKQPTSSPLRGHAETIVALAFSTDDSQLMSVDDKGYIAYWDLTTYKMLAQLKSEHPENLITAAFSADRKLLAMAGRFSLTLWDLDKRAHKGKRMYGPLFITTGLAFSPDGSRLLTGDSGTGIIEWDVASQAPIGDPVQADSEVLRVAYGPDGKRIASGTRWVTLWDAERRQPLGEPLRGHQINMTGISFNPDGSLLASSNSDNTIRLWDVENRTLIDVLHPGEKRGGVITIAFSPDGKQLASAGRDGIIRLWDVQLQTALKKVLEGHQGQVKSVAYSPDGDTIATGGKDSTIRLWDPETGQPRGPPLRGHGDGDIVALAFSPNGKRLVSGSIGWSSTIRLWDLESGKAIGAPLAEHQVPDKPYGVLVTEFDSQGKRFASGGWDRSVRLWDGETLKMQGEALKGHRASVLSLAFSPDGTMLASGGGSGTVSVWNAVTGDLMSQRKYGKERSVIGLGFSTDGSRLISVLQDGTVAVSETSSVKEIQRFIPAEETRVHAIAVTPDRKRMASLNAKGAIWLWNLDTFKRLDSPLRSASATSFVSSPSWSGLAFSPDGKKLASVAIGDELVIWDVDISTWRERACTLANRNLSQAEWDQYIGPERDYQLTCPGLPSGISKQ